MADSANLWQRAWYLKYLVFIFIYTFIVLSISFFMGIISLERESINNTNYDNITNIYSGEIKQMAPTLNRVSSGSENYKLYDLDDAIAVEYANNTNLISTNGDVQITADFVKKGLIYQPSYSTQFKADYILKNNLKKESVISFDFPFPSNVASREISNAKLAVDGVEKANVKARINGVNGLRWEGKVPAEGQVKITISYNTVGLSRFVYEGVENSKGAQDFKMKVAINGTRLYDVASGLAVDSREFGNNSTTIVWDKQALYSRPVINISVGDKLNPGALVSRVYATMVPLYLLIALLLVFLTDRFGKRMRLVDLAIVSILFTIFFPLFHYAASFTIDPTIELFSQLNVQSYSLPLYTAFIATFAVIGGLISYLLARTQGGRFAVKYGLPTVALVFGYFPLVATLPEYFGLLSLIGATFLVILAIQVRLNLTSK